MNQFILSSLLALSVISFSTAQAIPSVQPYTLYISNDGKQSIYYAMTSNYYDYTSFLSIPVNGLTDRNDVVGVLLPTGSATLVFTPLTNYYKFTNFPKSQYKFSFGHSLTSAQTDINTPSLVLEFNLGTTPYAWDISGNSVSSEGISCLYKTSTTSNCYINSDSSYFKY